MFHRRVAVIGAGYVGLTTSACLASLGHHVICADINATKVKRLREGELSIVEPGLPELVHEGLGADRLTFVVGAAAAVAGPVDVALLCLPTPMADGRAADTSAIESVVGEIGALLPPGCVVAIKSTVPVGTAARVAGLLNRDDLAVVSNPEFLREGTAVADFLHPDRVVIGAEHVDAAAKVAVLYAALGVPNVITDPASAELVKYAANCFLTMKLSYVNAIAELCERMGANIEDVTMGMGLDQRIGQAFLRPGPGYGGSCLPKDINALMRVSASAGFDFPLLRATIDINRRHQELIVAKVRRAAGGSLRGARIGLLGLSFKAGTDDLRDSPALAIAALLQAAGAELTGYDPALTRPWPDLDGVVRITEDAYHAAAGAVVLVLLTDWPEFRALDWPRLAGVMRGRALVDTRNHLDPQILWHAGIHWRGTGVPALHTEPPL